MDSRTHPASHYPDHRAWAEMLAGFAEKNARLSDIVAKRCPVRSGPALLTELERERSRIARELHAGAGSRWRESSCTWKYWTSAPPDWRIRRGEALAEVNRHG